MSATFTLLLCTYNMGTAISEQKPGVKLKTSALSNPGSGVQNLPFTSPPTGANDIAQAALLRLEYQ